MDIGQELNASGNSLNSQLTHTFKLGLDVDIKQIVAGIQCDHEPIRPAAHLTKEKLISWVKEKVTQGHTIWTVYELWLRLHLALRTRRCGLNRWS